MLRGALAAEFGPDYLRGLASDPVLLDEFDEHQEEMAKLLETYAIEARRGRKLTPGAQYRQSGPRRGGYSSQQTACPISGIPLQLYPDPRRGLVWDCLTSFSRPYSRP